MATPTRGSQSHRTPISAPLKSVGLFAGIGGIELGFHQVGIETEFFCEVDAAARAVLSARFPGVPVAEDVRDVRQLPKSDVVAAGFPCQDLSQAGGKAGIAGRNSGLVAHVFRLIESTRTRPRWLVLENVSYMLNLDSGRAMRWLTDQLSTLGFRWAYRVVDARSFGVPQRRQRVILVASSIEDPRAVLFADESPGSFVSHNSLALVSREAKAAINKRVEKSRLYGFYWTEGTRGLGWTIDAVPPIKGGSAVGIPSPPAVWIPASDFVGTPDLRDLERLQGFPADWTRPSEITPRGDRQRWRLVGNAVCADVAEWLGRRLLDPGECVLPHTQHQGARWPSAAWGEHGRIYAVEASSWPLGRNCPPLKPFLRYPLRPLSVRATAGFLRRATSGKLRFTEGFVDSVSAYLNWAEEQPTRASQVSASSA